MNKHALPSGSAGWRFHTSLWELVNLLNVFPHQQVWEKANFTFSARGRNSRLRHAAKDFGRVFEIEMNHNIPAGRAPDDYEALFVFARTVRRPRVEYGLWFPREKIRSKTGQAAEDSCQL